MTGPPWFAERAGVSLFVHDRGGVHEQRSVKALIGATTLRRGPILASEGSVIRWLTSLLAPVRSRQSCGMPGHHVELSDIECHENLLDGGRRRDAGTGSVDGERPVS